MEQNLNLSKINNICKALDDDKFQQNLIHIRDKIEGELKEFIKVFKAENNTIKVSEAIESRIKSSKSLEEKLERKNYVNKWKISSNAKENMHLLMNNLSDLIGLRITCYFKEDELALFNALLKYKFSFELKDDSKHNSKTGYSLYKATGVYDDGPNLYNFEIQVKSTMVSLWSEVQHDTIYKKKGFDVSFPLKEKLTDDLYKKISASDNSLKSIYFQTYEVDNLIQALFYEYTKKIIIDKHRTSFLGNHYDTFFELMNDKLISTKALKRYCGSYMNEEEYIKINYPIREMSDSEKKFSEILKNKYYPFYFEVFESIFDILFDKPDNVSIYDVISMQIINPLDLTDDSEEDDELFTDDKETSPDECGSDLDVYEKRASTMFEG